MKPCKSEAEKQTKSPELTLDRGGHTNPGNRQMGIFLVSMSDSKIMTKSNGERVGGPSLARVVREGLLRRALPSSRQSEEKGLTHKDLDTEQAVRQ